MNFIIENKEWIFSGIGVFIFSIILVIIRNKIKKRKKGNINSTTIRNNMRQVNQFGNKSIQIEKNEGDITIN